MDNTEYQLLKLINDNRTITNELEAFARLKISMHEGLQALHKLQHKQYILPGLFWNFITPGGRKALTEEKESFEIEILL